MEVTINCTAKVKLSENTFASLHTFSFGGNYMWSGLVLEVTGKDELGCNVYKAVGNTLCSDPLKFWLTPEEAIHDSIAQFYTDVDQTLEDHPAGPSTGMHSGGDYSDGCEDSYSGDIDPTGWDAADHKALYE